MTGTNTLSLAPTGTDKIDGANATVVALNAAKQVILLWSDGISNWKSSGTLPAPGWTSYTPTITAGSRTFTTVGATGRFLTIGKLTFVNIAVTITTNGTAGSWVNASLPNTANVEAILYGREDVVAGKMLQAKINPGTSIASIFNYDETYPGSNGALLILCGSYENI